MSFQRDTERIFSGGINLLPPGDLVPAGENIAATNWRADQQGMLRARRREQQVLTGYTAPITTLWIKESPASSNDRFVGDANSLYVANSLLAAGFDGHKLGLVSFQGSVWVMNRALQGRVRVEGTYVFRSWGPPIPIAPGVSAVAPAGAGLTGTYDYFVTYETSEGYESDLSPFATVTLAAQDAALVVPVSVDPTVTIRHIYRSGGTQVQVLRVADILDNVTVAYQDGMTDVAAEELGITHTADHDAPPAARGLVGPYFDRLIGYNSAAFPNRFWWTDQNKPSFFPGSNAAEGNWNDVGDDGEEILHVVQRPGMIIFYKTRSIWRCVGDPGSDGQLEQIATKVGLISESAIAEAGPLDYLESQNGIYVCNGDQVKKLSSKLDPIFQRDAIDTPGVDIPLIAADGPARSQSVMAHRQGRLYFSYAGDTSLVANQSLVYDIGTDQWFADSRAFTALFDEGQPFNLVGALAGSGSVVVVDANIFGAIDVNLQTRFLDQGLPNNLKTYADLVIVHNLLGSALTVTATYDFGRDADGFGAVAPETLGDISSNGRTETTIPFNLGEGRQAKNISIGIAGSLNNEGRIYSAHLHYKTEQRDGLTFDTGPMTLGASDVKEVSAFAADVVTTDVLNWTLYADMPSGQLTVVKTGVIAHVGTAQRGVQEACDLAGEALPEGKVFRLVITSPGGFRVYGLQFLVRRLGVYLVAGQGYHTRELPLASSRIGLVKKLELDARTDGNLTVTISTNEPAPITARLTSTISALTRRWSEFRLPVNTRGRHLRLDLDPAAPARIYSARAWVKRIGDAGISSWEWMPIPIAASEEEFQWTSIAVDAK